MDDVVDALLDPGTHHTWVSRLDESVVLAKDGAELVADADDAQVVYYRFALPFPCWDRQVSAALYCDRTEGGGARVELRRVSLPPPSEKPRRRRRKPKKRGDRVVGWTTAAAERFGPTRRRGVAFDDDAASDRITAREGSLDAIGAAETCVELPAVDAQRERGGTMSVAPRHLRERHGIASKTSKSEILISKHRFVLWAPPVLRNKVSRVRPNAEKQHGVVRSDCVTLPAFRVDLRAPAARRGPDARRADARRGPRHPLPAVAHPVGPRPRGPKRSRRSRRRSRRGLAERGAAANCGRRRPRGPRRLCRDTGRPRRANDSKAAAETPGRRRSLFCGRSTVGSCFVAPRVTFTTRRAERASGFAPGPWRRSSSPPTGTGRAGAPALHSDREPSASFSVAAFKKSLMPPPKIRGRRPRRGTYRYRTTLYASRASGARTRP